MANRRLFTGYDQSSLTQPSSMMSPRGGTAVEDDPMAQYMEHPNTMRRRVTPIVGEPQPSNTMLQDLLAMMKGGQ